MALEIPPGKIHHAVTEFWSKRDSQRANLADQGKSGGSARAAGHLSSLEQLVADCFLELGIPRSCITMGSSALPGYYRISKKWDLTVVHHGHLLAAFEFKSQVGSVGKNYNNRFEEALGSATDLQAAQQEFHAFGSVPPWLVYIFVLEETSATEAEVGVPRTLFPTDPVYDGLSYNERYQTMISRFLSHRIYNAAWYLTTKRDTHGNITFTEPLATACSRTLAVEIESRVKYVRTVVDSAKHPLTDEGADLG